MFKTIVGLKRLGSQILFVAGITQLSQFQAQVFVKNLTEISVDFEIGQICEGQMLPGQKCLFVTCL